MRTIKKSTSMFLILTLVFSLFSFNISFASSGEAFENSTIVKEKIDNRIIGKSDKSIYSNKRNAATIQNLIPNKVVFDWVATEDGVIIKLTNYGVDSVDLVSGTINTGSVQEPFSIFAVTPGNSSHTISGVPIKKCSERISITWSAKDGNNVFNSATSTGSREIPLELLNKWGQGSFGSKQACLDYHFNVHGFEVSTTNICSYVRAADNFRTTIALSGQKPSKLVAGATPNVYRYQSQIYYLDVICINNTPIGALISFGTRG